MQLQKARKLLAYKYTWPNKFPLFSTLQPILLFHGLPPWKIDWGHVFTEGLIKDSVGFRHCCFRCFLSFVARLRME